MKCPKCGSKNSDANRFCRACGCRLESIGEVEPQVAPEAAVVDEVALGEQLFDVWQLYSAGDIDGALAKIEMVSHSFPERSSIHSLFALIYERKAEMQIEAGNVEAARGLLLEALDRYEKIVAMNPDSAADRQKRESLRRKLGAAGAKPKASIPQSIPAAIRSIPAAIKALPPGVVPAAAVFLLVLVVLGFVLAPESSTQPRRATATTSATATTQTRTRPAHVAAAPESEVVTEPAPSPQPVVTSPSRLYTFPAEGERPVPKPPAATTPKPPAPSSLPPLKVPELPNVRVTPAKPKPPAPPKPAADKPKRSIPPDQGDDSEKTTTADGATTLARAIKLYDQGYNQQAVTAAQQAIVLFDAEAAAGKNTAAAKRGAENARKLIGLWQTPANEEEQ